MPSPAATQNDHFCTTVMAKSLRVNPHGKKPIQYSHFFVKNSISLALTFVDGMNYFYQLLKK